MVQAWPQATLLSSHVRTRCVHIFGRVTFLSPCPYGVLAEPPVLPPAAEHAAAPLAPSSLLSLHTAPLAARMVACMGGRAYSVLSAYPYARHCLIRPLGNYWVRPRASALPAKFAGEGPGWWSVGVGVLAIQYARQPNSSLIARGPP